MRVILLGPPGAGKGTQAVRIAHRASVPHVGTGDLLRAAVAHGTDLGLRARAYMERGELVPDDLVLEMLRRRLEEPDARAGFVLDGFPRNPAQAEALDAILEETGLRVDHVVALEVPDDEIVARLSSRASCPGCGRTFALPGPILGSATCDYDGTPLVQRDDDLPEVVRRRLEVFRHQTEPVIAHYQRHGLLTRVPGVGEVPDVSDRIAKELGLAS